MSEWISVKDRLPEDDTHVLINDGDNTGIGVYDIEDELWTAQTWWSEYHLVSHWMPLPNPPEV